jgi:hypothetical protein
VFSPSPLSGVYDFYSLFSFDNRLLLNMDHRFRLTQLNSSEPLTCDALACVRRADERTHFPRARGDARGPLMGVVMPRPHASHTRQLRSGEGPMVPPSRGTRCGARRCGRGAGELANWKPGLTATTPRDFQADRFPGFRRTVRPPPAGP